MFDVFKTKTQTINQMMMGDLPKDRNYTVKTSTLKKEVECSWRCLEITFGLVGFRVFKRAAKRSRTQKWTNEKKRNLKVGQLVTYAPVTTRQMDTQESIKIHPGERTD
ncbi:hypothetical protein TNIN_153681 [Trichonephila inaurata madagascariensis]|uniref:Uncharacterized protein n=1 Tax=Trichonephila inaurata madagascariensis TaxID=2747483 RepID=A0A8X6XUU5_9ARAC|nr:hypothetical protein TNIN_153681 [Trichonephila inaurata madagascariensis]